MTRTGTFLEETLGRDGFIDRETGLLRNMTGLHKGMERNLNQYREGHTEQVVLQQGYTYSSIPLI